jgi:hypothetical protein
VADVKVWSEVGGHDGLYSAINSVAVEHALDTFLVLCPINGPQPADAHS